MKILLLFSIAALLTAQQKLTERERSPMYLSEDGSLNPLDKQLVPQLDGDHVQFVINQDSADGIRLAAVTSDKSKQVVSGAFEDKSSAKPEQAIDKVPVLDTFEDRRDNRPGVRLIPIRVVKYGEHAYKVIPQRKLPPGEYVVNTADGEFLFVIR